MPKLRTVKEHPKILIAGPNRVGKSSTMDALEIITSYGIERGGKDKVREGGPQPEDGTRKDGNIVSRDEFLRKKENGLYELDYYNGIDTFHGVLQKDAARTDKFIGYIADTYGGAYRFIIHFPRLISFFFHTEPRVMGERLKRADIPPEQIRKRLATYEAQLALFLQNASQFYFPILTKQRQYYPPDYSTEEIKKLDQEEINANARRIVGLINEYTKHYRPDMSVTDFHNAYVGRKIRGLLGVEISDLEERVKKQGRPINLSLKDQLSRYGDTPDDIKEIVEKGLPVVEYANKNGRHNILVQVPREPYKTDLKLEETVLDLIGLKIGTPTLREPKEASFLRDSKFGLVHVENALLRDGVLYSLGDPIRDVPAHTGLAVSFVYKNGKRIEITGLTAGDLSKGYALGVPFEASGIPSNF